jgi:hypothetical protein
VDTFEQVGPSGRCVTGQDVVEVPLALTAGQAEQLHEAAGRLGLSPARVVRLAIRRFLQASPAGRAAPQEGLPCRTS